MKGIPWRVLAPVALLLLASVVPSATFAVADRTRPGQCDRLPAGQPSGGFVERDTEVRAAELQVFSSKPSVSGAKLADDDRGHDDDDDD